MLRWVQNAARLTLLAMVFASCEESTPTPPPAAPVAPAPQPSAVAETPPAPAVAETARSAKACLMTHICGCNLGCTRMPLAPGSLREGLSAIAETGPYSGKELKVIKEADATGAQVFALADRDHDNSCERSPEARSLVGFACAKKDSGPIPANACANAKSCDE